MTSRLVASMAFQDKVAECVVYLLMLNLIKFKYCLPTSAQQILYWFCSGDYSTLTYNDCQGNYYNTTGCYFIENFSQYRPCSAICNDVAYNSINEEKCRAYCDGECCWCWNSLFLPMPKTTKDQIMIDPFFKCSRNSLLSSPFSNGLYCLTSILEFCSSRWMKELWDERNNYRI